MLLTNVPVFQEYMMSLSLSAGKAPCYIVNTYTHTHTQRRKERKRERERERDRDRETDRHGFLTLTSGDE